MENSEDIAVSINPIIDLTIETPGRKKYGPGQNSILCLNSYDYFGPKCKKHDSRTIKRKTEIDSSLVFNHNINNMRNFLYVDPNDLNIPDRSGGHCVVMELHRVTAYAHSYHLVNMRCIYALNDLSQMSDDMYSDEDIPPSQGPSNSKLLNVCLFRKRKLVEEITIESDTDVSDVPEKIAKTVKNQVKIPKTRSQRKRQKEIKNQVKSTKTRALRRQKESDTDDSDVPEKISKTVKNQVKIPKTRSQRKRQKESDTDDSDVPEKISKTVKNQVKSSKTRALRRRQKESDTDDSDVPEKVSKTVKNQVKSPKTRLQRKRQKESDTDDSVVPEKISKTATSPQEKKVREEVDTVIVIDSDDDNVEIEPEEVKVKAESYISVSDSESHISYEATQVESSDDIMYAQTQKVEVEEEQQSEVIVFYEDKRIKDFVTYLQTQGLERN
ncbi:unnamed protein product [Mytilus coruscus]|uniref:Uncharacterized protein n=1 Tax=Mytilus coruscus TaxID=42192 RepID=A0A6J8DKF4_MYTCO|nr:unnamed protein product [Mytilus coruscus]